METKIVSVVFLAIDNYEEFLHAFQDLHKAYQKLESSFYSPLDDLCLSFGLDKVETVGGVYMLY